MRQRIKVTEWWERETEGGFRYRWRNRDEAIESARINGGKAFHVTRYRLAPLVRLRWVQSVDDCFLDATDGNICRASVRPAYDEWCARVWHDDHPVYAATVAEAKAACAARLRELGYLVVGNG